MYKKCKFIHELEKVNRGPFKTWDCENNSTVGISCDYFDAANNESGALMNLRRINEGKYSMENSRDPEAT